MTTIKNSTLDFLSELSSNNDREWFQQNKALYLAAKENVEAFAEAVIQQFRLTNSRIPSDLVGKKSVKRIYRDVRFRKDKSPYKTNFGISITTGAKGIHAPGFFIQIEPNRSFVAGGMWVPETDDLKSIRQEIDYSGDQLIEVLEKASFKAFFPDGLQQNYKLKTTPKNYDDDHPRIELLKLKSFSVSSPLTDNQLTTNGIVEQIIARLSQITPLNDFLQDAIATD